MPGTVVSAYVDDIDRSRTEDSQEKLVEGIHKIGLLAKSRLNELGTSLAADKEVILSNRQDSAEAIGRRLGTPLERATTGSAVRVGVDCQLATH